MKKIFTIIILTLLPSNISYSKDNPYKFLKKEILIGKAKKELVNDTRSISKKKALSIVDDENGKAIKITLDSVFGAIVIVLVADKVALEVTFK